MKASFKMALAAILVAVGVVIAPFFYIPFVTTKAYPGQHMVNTIAGVLLGPWWAAGIAIVIGLIRMSLGVGTIYSMPGGVPGGLVVGLVAWAIRKTGFKRVEFAALAEPIGTALIGGTLALYVVAPFIGDERLAAIGLIPLWGLWAASSVTGSVLGFIILGVLQATGIYSFTENHAKVSLDQNS